MTQIDIISYRKLSFAKRFGFTVRDLMILKSMIDCESVTKIHWYERPDTVLDLFKNESKGLSDELKIFAPRVIDWNFIGALRHGRAWAASSFKLYPQFRNPGFPQKKIILDFNPFFVPPKEYLEESIYWYDAIDNFLLHNRFTAPQLEAVSIKYDFVREHANFITGVTAKSLSPFGRGEVLPNRLIKKDWGSVNSVSNKLYDYGFIGFITDKFDLELVEALCKRNRTVLIAGEAYDKSVKKKLTKIPGVTYLGRFNSSHVREILSRFKVGLIPYLRDKLHDESPIKFFQYVCAGLPVITSTKFNEIENLFSRYVHYYDLDRIADLDNFFCEMSRNYAENNTAIMDIALTRSEIFWDGAITEIIESVKSSKMASINA